MWDLIHPYNKSIIKQITVSIDACTKSTYEYIRRGGDFNRLLDNLQFIYRIRESGQIDSLVTSFTISAYNVHEAVEFCEFARRLGFDKVEYWVVQDWRRGDTYTAMAAHVPNSQHYSTFCDVIERIRELKNNSLGIDVLCGY
jgi:MoaA/NifB/PqqE/SkfB family radical SAM enzyme